MLIDEGDQPETIEVGLALPVRRAGTLLTASFRPRLTAAPLLFG
jgi:hypothetical protein